MVLNRRRFLAISAAAMATGPARAATPLRQFHGVALGARATITLAHDNAAAIATGAFAEIDRLEDIFSLYRPLSALSRLNHDGHLEAPPPELLECLSLCDAVHRASEGRFDPTIQPLWSLYAKTYAGGRQPTASEIDAALARTGWHGVAMSAAEVRLEQSGMAITLNGIGQGYIADRVAHLFRQAGLTDILIDTGELYALGQPSENEDWQCDIRAPDGTIHGHAALRDVALASSAPLGTTFASKDTAGHILDPGSGRPAKPYWRSISVGAPQAAIADALSTAACLMQKPDIESALSVFPRAQLVAALEH